MKRIFGLPKSRPTSERPAVTVGMFDGVHVGHQAVLKRLVTVASGRKTQSVILTFDRHPRGIVGKTPPPMITSLEHRLALFEEMGADAAVVLPFDESLARMSADEFTREILAGRLEAQTLVVGWDTHFGRGRAGNVDFLRAAGRRYGFDVVELPRLDEGDHEVSSTAVRNAIRNSDLDAARELLGRPASVMGTVVHGKGVGHELGFPTLNLNLHHELHPPQGVYATRTRAGDCAWPSATFIGSRTTRDALGPDDVIIESHIIGRNVGDLYGQTARVDFVRRLRRIRRFESREELAAAIRDDVEAIRKILESDS